MPKLTKRANLPILIIEKLRFKTYHSKENKNNSLMQTTLFKTI